VKTTLKKWQGWEILSIEGILVLRELNQARDALEYFEHRSGTKVALDLSRTKALDSSGLSLLLNFQKRLRGEGGMMVILEPSKEIRPIFGMLEKGDTVPVYYARSEFESAVTAGSI
jgi:anti-anti-sigma factor